MFPITNDEDEGFINTRADIFVSDDFSKFLRINYSYEEMPWNGLINCQAGNDIMTHHNTRNIVRGQHSEQNGDGSL